MTDHTLLAFVAYSGKDTNLAGIAARAVARANAQPTGIRYHPWAYNDVPGNPLASPILEGIDDSTFVVADITYLNLNVVYEVGCTIGRKKRAFLVRHQGTTGDKDLAKAVGIFDTLGYFEYQDVDALHGRLTSHIDPLPPQIDEVLDRKAPVYVVEPPSRGDAETMMVSRLEPVRNFVCEA